MYTVFAPSHQQSFLASHFRSKHEKTPRIETKSEVHIIENTLPVRDEPLVVNKYQ